MESGGSGASYRFPPPLSPYTHITGEVRSGCYATHTVTHCINRLQTRLKPTSTPGARTAPAYGKRRSLRPYAERRLLIADHLQTTLHTRCVLAARIPEPVHCDRIALEAPDALRRGRRAAGRSQNAKQYAACRRLRQRDGVRMVCVRLPAGTAAGVRRTGLQSSDSHSVWTSQGWNARATSANGTLTRHGEGTP